MSPQQPQFRLIRSSSRFDQFITNNSIGGKGLRSLAKTQEQTNRLPPRTLILDFTMTHTRYGRSIQHTTGQLTHTRRSDGVPDPDVFSRKWSGTKYGTIVKFTIDQTQYLSYQ